MNRSLFTPHLARPLDRSEKGRKETASRLRCGLALTSAVLSAVWTLYAQLFSVALVYENGSLVRCAVVNRALTKTKPASPPAQTSECIAAAVVPIEDEIPITQQLESTLLGSVDVAQHTTPPVFEVLVVRVSAWPVSTATPVGNKAPYRFASVPDACGPYAHAPPLAT